MRRLSLKNSVVAFVACGCLAVPAEAKGWTAMDEQRGYLSGDEETVILTRREPQPASNVVRVAKVFKGLPYVWAGTTPESGFDCSGYVYEVMRLNGYSVPRMADHQFEASTRVEKAALRAGDMVFFTTYLPGPSHVGIYLGDGEFIHASSAAEGVVVSQLRDGYYAERFLGGGRPAEWIPDDSTLAEGAESNVVAVNLEQPETEIMPVEPVQPEPEESMAADDSTTLPNSSRDPFSPRSVDGTSPFQVPIKSKADEAGMKLKLQLGELAAVGRIGLSNLLDRVVDIFAFSATNEETNS